MSMGLQIGNLHKTSKVIFKLIRLVQLYNYIYVSAGLFVWILGGNTLRGRNDENVVLT